MTIDLHGISQEAFDLIVFSEVTSRDAYDKRYRRPIRPGGQSGITIGIGYDLGYQTAATIRKDWGHLLPAHMVAAAVSVAGLKGAQAANRLASVRDKIDVPWSAAVAVFSAVSIPKYQGMARRVLKHFDELHPHCNGALTSLTFNRGASYTLAGERYREMRAIRTLMAERKFSGIPAQIRAMKRIWTKPELRGVRIRRDNEAKLFERGLKEGAVA
jgi:hypothetical protein